MPGTDLGQEAELRRVHEGGSDPPRLPKLASAPTRGRIRGCACPPPAPLLLLQAGEGGGRALRESEPLPC
jgi:hypothetical protein